MKASDLFIRSLEQEGVEFIFGVPGEENLDFLESLRTSKIKLILTRHEQGAGFMAATYGRLTGKVGVCISTLGPGVTNFVTCAAYAQFWPASVTNRDCGEDDPIEEATPTQRTSQKSARRAGAEGRDCGEDDPITDATQVHRTSEKSARRVDAESQADQAANAPAKVASSHAPPEAPSSACQSTGLPRQIPDSRRRRMPRAPLAGGLERTRKAMRAKQVSDPYFNKSGIKRVADQALFTEHEKEEPFSLRRPLHFSKDVYKDSIYDTEGFLVKLVTQWENLISKRTK